MPKKLKGYRTVLFNVIAALPALAEIVTQVAVDPTVHAIIPPQYLPHYLAAVTIGNIVLRAVTNTPLGKAKPAPKPQEAVAQVVVEAISEKPAVQPGQKPRQPGKSGAARR